MKNQVLAIVLLGTLAGCGKQKQEAVKAERLSIIEGFPPERATSLRARAQALANVRPPSGFAPYYFIAITKRWVPGSTVTVAFRGGSRDLHQSIAQIASTWAANGNIGLDFGYDPATGYRKWQTTDTTPSAQVRVAFDGVGYWSCVGMDSVDPACAQANQQSMNLQGFDQALPGDWRSTTLHEFGHAYGFEHEHQNPEGGCEQQFRFESSAGYLDTKDTYGQFVADNAGRQPGIYKVLGGPPNNWSKQMVDDNLRRLPNSSAFGTSAFDNLSIMKYAFPSWMYVNGKNSICYSLPNSDLSPFDRQGLATLYPRRPAEIISATKQLKSAVSALSKTEGLPSDLKSVLTERALGLSSVK